MSQLHVIDESFQVMINLLILDLNVLDLVALICVSIGVFVCIHVHLVLEKNDCVFRGVDLEVSSLFQEEAQCIVGISAVCANFCVRNLLLLFFT